MISKSGMNVAAPSSLRAGLQGDQNRSCWGRCSGSPSIRSAISDQRVVAVGLVHASQPALRLMWSAMKFSGTPIVCCRKRAISVERRLNPVGSMKVNVKPSLHSPAISSAWSSKAPL